MTRSMPTLSRRALNSGISCMVEQLGLAMMPSCVGSILVVDAGHDQRHARLHAPLRGVVDHDRAARGGLRGEDLGGAAAGREDGDVDALEGVGRGRPRPASERPAEVDAAAVGARRQRAQLADREVALGEDLDHGSSHQSGGADDSDRQGAVGGLDGHVVIPVGLPSRARDDDTASMALPRPCCTLPWNGDLRTLVDSPCR